MSKEFQNGYKKCLEDIKKGLDNLKDYSKETLNNLLRGLVQEENVRVKPTVYFTTLNKNGELVPDWEKTYSYSNCEKNLKEQNKESIRIVTTRDPKKIEKIKKQMGVDQKTLEMVKAENAIMFGKTSVLTNDKQNPYYWNMLGQQITGLSQNERNSVNMFIVAGVDPNEENAMENLLKKAGEEGFIFDFVKN